MIEEKIKAYMAKLEQIDAERENLKSDFYMQSKIEAHLEMLCLLGFMEILDKTSKRK